MNPAIASAGALFLAASVAPALPTMARAGVDQRVTASKTESDDEIVPCSGARDLPVCSLPDLSEQAVRKELGGNLIAIYPEGNTLLVAALGIPELLRFASGKYSNFHRIAPDVQTIRLRIKDLKTKGLSFTLRRGEKVLLSHRIEAASSASIGDRMIAFDVPYGEEMQRVSIYSPPGVENGKNLPIIYLADGQGLEAYAKAVDSEIVRGSLPPIYLVGIWSKPESRKLRYMVDDSDHLSEGSSYQNFFIQKLRPMIEARLKDVAPQTRIVAGFSNGADWAISNHAVQADLFPDVLAMSPVWVGTPSRVSSTSGGRYFLAAGTQDAAALSVAGRTARAVRHPASLCYFQANAGHNEIFWRDAFVTGLGWLLGGQRCPVGAKLK